jgi:hypothetical protein
LPRSPVHVNEVPDAFIGVLLRGLLRFIRRRRRGAALAFHAEAAPDRDRFLGGLGGLTEELLELDQLSGTLIGGVLGAGLGKARVELGRRALEGRLEVFWFSAHVEASVRAVARVAPTVSQRVCRTSQVRRRAAVSCGQAPTVR